MHGLNGTQAPVSRIVGQSGRRENRLAASNGESIHFQRSVVPHHHTQAVTIQINYDRNVTIQLNPSAATALDSIVPRTNTPNLRDLLDAVECKLWIDIPPTNTPKLTKATKKPNEDLSEDQVNNYFDLLYAIFEQISENDLNEATGISLQPERETAITKWVMAFLFYPNFQPKNSSKIAKYNTFYSLILKRYQYSEDPETKATRKQEYKTLCGRLQSIQEQISIQSSVARALLTEQVCGQALIISPDFKTDSAELERILNRYQGLEESTELKPLLTYDPDIHDSWDKYHQILDIYCNLDTDLNILYQILNKYYILLQTLQDVHSYTEPNCSDWNEVKQSAKTLIQIFNQYHNFYENLSELKLILKLILSHFSTPVRKIPGSYVDAYVKWLLSTIGSSNDPLQDSNWTHLSAFYTICRMHPPLMSSDLFKEYATAVTRTSSKTYADIVFRAHGNAAQQKRFVYKLILMLDTASVISHGRRFSVDKTAANFLLSENESFEVIGSLNTLWEKSSEGKRALLLLGLSSTLSSSLEPWTVLSKTKDLSIIKAYQALEPSQKHTEASTRADLALSGSEKRVFSNRVSDLTQNKLPANSLSVSELIQVLLLLSSEGNLGEVFTKCLRALVLKMRKMHNPSFINTGDNEFMLVLDFIRDLGLLDHIALALPFESTTALPLEPQEFVATRNLHFMDLARAATAAVYSCPLLPVVQQRIEDTRSNPQQDNVLALQRTETLQRLLLMSSLGQIAD
ncbi:MAG: hypothetical protein V4591_09680 [Bdellovibrionota bacterium]